MKSTIIVGVVLLLLGVAGLSYDHFSYTTQEKVLQLGPITATAETTHTVPLPRILGWVLVAAGTCVIAFGALSNKR